MQDPRQQLVASGYDAMAERYRDWSGRVVDPTRDRLFDRLVATLPDRARVFDLGCGAGVPWTRRLAARFDVVGVDISETQVRLARQNVPAASFMVTDLVPLDLAPGSLDAVTAFYWHRRTSRPSSSGRHLRRSAILLFGKGCALPTRHAQAARAGSTL